MRVRLRCVALLALLGVATGNLTAAERARAEGHIQAATVKSHDGVPLAGRIIFPRPPRENERFPVVLWSSPYAGTLDAQVDQPQSAQVGDREMFLQGRQPIVPVVTLLQHGYAVAGFHVRGTGNSGGCYDMFGGAEQADQRVLLDWVAAQPWSSGSIAMLGHSSDAITALWGGVSAHPALKTIVVSGLVTDFYTAVFSPQGAVIDDQMWSAAAPFFAALTAVPPRPSIDPVPAPGDPPQNFLLSGYLGQFPARVCRQLAEDLAVTAGDTFARNTFSVWRNRSAAWYDERRVLSRLGRVNAAVLLWHGFQDYLAFEEDRVWEALTAAPKWQWEGQWRHTTEPMYRYREEILVPWLNYWLKNEGAPPPDLNRVTYQVAPPRPSPLPEDPPIEPRDVWPKSSAWPPSEATEVTLRLAPSGLRGKPSPQPRTFHARPDEAERQTTIQARDPESRPIGYAPPCPGTADGDTRLVYETLPMTETTVIAGNPSARLLLKSSLRGGSFSVQLFDLAPDFGCIDGQPTGFEFLTEGGVDLRYLGDRYKPTDFPEGEQQVRVDLQSLAEDLEPGHRLAAILSLGPQKARVAQGYFPELTISGASRLLLPVTKGQIPAG